MSKVLAACEMSGTIVQAFHSIGFDNVYSCDLLPTIGAFPERHFQADVLSVLYSYSWDIVIAFPPCTYLSNCSEYLFKDNPERWKKRFEAVDFVKKIWEYPSRMCIENPKGYLNCHWKKPTQVIYPYQFGHPVSKRTCLWLRDLPMLLPTDIYISHDGFPSYVYSVHGAVNRSLTFPGIADAMASQWIHLL